eukprot:7625921-Pyramimonas_sp.AAC.1
MARLLLAVACRLPRRVQHEPLSSLARLALVDCSASTQPKQEARLVVAAAALARCRHAAVAC